MTVSRALATLLAVLIAAHLVLADFSIAPTKRTTKRILSFGSRTPGTPGHRLAKQYLRKTFSNIPGWSEQKTQRLQPHIDRLNSNLNMENIVVNFKLPTAKPENADQELVLACHYDSKYFKEGEFLGATDSAVPCAMLITLAKEISKRSKVYHMLNNKASVGVVSLIFFDGEEAFGEWSKTDSKYGSKALAREWEAENKLEKISLFVLLDLIGAANPRFHNYPVHKGTTPRTNTEKQYAALAKIERSLYAKSAKFLFEDATDGLITTAAVDDDHAPFAHRGVPVLHLIPSPFPRVWHTLEDNEQALDWPTTKRVQNVVFKFVFNYLYPESAKNH